MIQPFNDEYFMRQALKEAQKAFDEDEIPIGAVIVCKGQIIARAYNQTERLKDFTAHAEMLAFTSASEYLGGKYLNECKLYVTVEPCVMCCGASFWTRIGEVFYATPDHKRGVHSQGINHFHPKTKVTTGILQEEAQELMKSFFQKKR
jgi:tRNA(adenine34) deaminase